MEVESDGVAGVAGSDDSHVEEEGGWMEVGPDDVVGDAVRSASATDSDDRAVGMLDAESEDEEDEEMDKEGSDDGSGPLRLGMTIRNGRQAAVRFLHEQLSSCQCRCDEGRNDRVRRSSERERRRCRQGMDEQGLRPHELVEPPVYDMNELCDHWDEVLHTANNADSQGSESLADIVRLREDGWYDVRAGDMKAISWQSLLADEWHSPRLDLAMSDLRHCEAMNPVRRTFDIDSFLMQIQSLTFFKGGFRISYCPQFTTDITANLHIRVGRHHLHRTRHLRLRHSGHSYG